jgi:hypothetical protein
MSSRSVAVSKQRLRLLVDFQPQRNLVLLESAKERLSDVPKIGFFQVTFEKLFFAPCSKGEFSIGPERYDDLGKWLAGFKHEERLRHQIEDFHELILPVAMLSKFPAIWTPEGIVFRADIFKRIEDFFSWGYFHKGSSLLNEQAGRFLRSRADDFSEAIERARTIHRLAQVQGTDGVCYGSGGSPIGEVIRDFDLVAFANCRVQFQGQHSGTGADGNFSCVRSRAARAGARRDNGLQCAERVHDSRA